MKLVAGLGNPGYDYVLTPHNLGFMAADLVAEDCGVEIARREDYALTARATLEGVSLLLAKPQTFMNLSGPPIRRLLQKYEIAVEDLIVFVDDANLPFGAIRIRPHGSAGGHNGLKSIIGALDSDQFARIRMGIQPERPPGDLAGYVLDRFRKKDLEQVAEMVGRAVDALRAILFEGIPAAMNRFNRRAAS